MTHKHWENPEVLGFGRLPARATMAPPAARCLPLNGVWRFTRLSHPDQAKADWAAPDFKDTAEDWHDMVVPSLWTRPLKPATEPLTPDRPIYTNVQMPFRCEPPGVPVENPTGLYRRSFKLPASWRKKRVVIYLGGVENSYYLFVNGREVGFAKDCRLPSEFDLTDYLVHGTNTLAIMVMRWSDSSYIEDQDQWWQAGIHRDLWLYWTEANYLRDVFAKPAYDVNTGTGQLCLEVRVGGTHRSALQHSVRVSLTKPDGKSAFKTPLQATVEKHNYQMVTGKGPLLKLTKSLGRVQPWSAETPHLYTATVELLDPLNRCIETAEIKVGFRHIEISNRELLINGQPVLIRGVNRHDHCDVTGKVMSPALWRKDIETMKRHNINAVRTSHYPNDPAFYALCDEYGLYVVDEANLEAHHHYAQLGADPFWANAFLSRVTRMVERDKNHPCIISWSMGNETGYGPNHAAMAAWVRTYDPSRPIHNENAICEQGVRAMWDENPLGTDLICPMYPSVADIIQHAVESTDPRPLIMCEYAHAMGNSGGNLKEYWQAIESHHGLQGGFIWEWLDHGLAASANGVPYWAYGGDFGEDRHDLNFVCDGLCWPDRTPHSSLIEFKRVIQPVAISHRKGRQYRISNKNYFTDLSCYQVSWSLLRNGIACQTGRLPRLATAPQGHSDFALDVELPRLRAGEELSIVFRVCLRRDSHWAPKGHEVAVCQLPLRQRKRARRRYATAARLSSRGGQHQVSLGDEVFSFDKRGLHSWQHRAQERLVCGPMLNIWRAPLDNDGIKGWVGQDNKPLGRWLKAGINTPRHTNQSIRAIQNEDGLTLTCEQTTRLATGRIRMTSQYRFSQHQECIVSHQFQIDQTLPDLPRIGVRMALPGRYEGFRWFGRGPHETYIDRNTSGIVAQHDSTVSDQYVPYILPQDHGNLTDIRWLQLYALDDATRDVFHIHADSTMEASASHYPHEILTPAFHTHELAPQDVTWVSLDAMQRGVGGASCGPDTLPQYRVEPGIYHLRYRLGGVAHHD